MALFYNYIRIAATDTDAHLTPRHIVIYIYIYIYILYTRYIYIFAIILDIKLI